VQRLFAGQDRFARGDVTLKDIAAFKSALTTEANVTAFWKKFEEKKGPKNNGKYQSMVDKALRSSMLLMNSLILRIINLSKS
jgi:hypothetical protein